MKWLAWGGLALGLLFVAILGLGLVTGIIPAPLHDLALVEARIVHEITPAMASREPPRPGQPYLRVTVASGQNLIAKGARSELNIYPIVADCADEDVTLFAYGPYYQGLGVSYLGADSSDHRLAALAKARADRYEYQLFIPLTGRPNSESDFNRRMPPYDLRRENRILCIRVGGGNMALGHFRSNEIRVRMPNTAE